MDAYAVGIGPEPPHPLAPEQRIEAIDAFESNLGLDGYVRVV